MEVNKMIVSVSRRTDIPAFYTEWFLNRVKDGYVDVINPFNSKQANRISLKKDDVDCFVFWTKNTKKGLKNRFSLKKWTQIGAFLLTDYR